MVFRSRKSFCPFLQQEFTKNPAELKKRQKQLLMAMTILGKSHEVLQ